MKLNATAELMPVTWKEFSLPHPFVPTNQMEGYKILFNDLVNDLKDPVLLIDMEAGDLSVTNKQCDTIKVRTVEELFDLAVIIGGSNPAIVDPKEWFSQAHYDRVNDAVGGREKFLGRYMTIMFDSLTEMGRIFLKWAEKQPEN